MLKTTRDWNDIQTIVAVEVSQHLASCCLSILTPKQLEWMNEWKNRARKQSQIVVRIGCEQWFESRSSLPFTIFFYSRGVFSFFFFFFFTLQSVQLIVYGPMANIICALVWTNTNGQHIVFIVRCRTSFAYSSNDCHRVTYGIMHCFSAQEIVVSDGNRLCLKFVVQLLLLAFTICRCSLSVVLTTVFSYVCLFFLSIYLWCQSI